MDAESVLGRSDCLLLVFGPVLRLRREHRQPIW
jgi:hypothetical protein